MSALRIVRQRGYVRLTDAEGYFRAFTRTEFDRLTSWFLAGAKGEFVWPVNRDAVLCEVARVRGDRLVVSIQARYAEGVVIPLTCARSFSASALRALLEARYSRASRAR